MIAGRNERSLREVGAEKLTQQLSHIIQGCQRPAFDETTKEKEDKYVKTGRGIEPYNKMMYD
jgi:hypothetical protein